jgi:hypothetical protein
MNATGTSHGVSNGTHSQTMGAPLATSEPRYPHTLYHRDYAVLAAVEAGRCDLLCGSEPDLIIDDKWFCDQVRVHDLIAAGLLTPTIRGIPGRRVPAILTDAGKNTLALGRASRA